MVRRPKVELKINRKIDRHKIMGPFDSDCTYYRFQEQYALVLWALQEKFDFSFEEATFYCSDIFRAEMSDFFYLYFDLDFDGYSEWYEYLNQRVTLDELEQYVGKIELNLYEGNNLQWF